MVSMAIHNLDFGRSVVDFVACGCSSNASIGRCYFRKYVKTVLPNIKNNGVFCRQKVGRCRVYSTKTPETLVNGVGPLLESKKESRTNPISLPNLFEVVADDLQTLNRNLKTVPARN